MATGKSGSYEILNGCYTVKVDWVETFDVASNTSELSLDIFAKSNDWYGWQYYLSGDISVDGTPVVAFDSTVWTHMISIPSQNTYYGVTTKDGYAKPPWKVTIPHNTDGTKQVTIALAFNGWTGDYPDHISCFDTRTIELTSIPRASTIGATNANIGAVSMIAVNRKSTAYTHSIQYVFGAVSGYVTADGGTSAGEVKFGDTSVPFTLPASFYSQIPKAKAGIGSLICRTYSGSTQIGDAQTATFTAYAAEADCAPIVSGTVVDSNETTKALTGDVNVLVRYYSTALCTIAATARNSASITAKAIGGVTVSENTRSIANIESGAVTFSATDSRGYTTTPPPVMKSLVPYIRLTNNPAVARPEPTTGRAILTLKGDYFKGSFGAVENTLAAQYRIDGGDPVDIPVEITDNSYTASVELTGMDYMRSFQFEVVVTDKLSSVSKKTTLLRGIPVFDWGESDFNFNVPASAPAPTSAEHLINLGYAQSLFAPAVESEEHSGCYYRTVEGVTEWINPPMNVGVEYRTTKRYNGRAVFCKLVDVGTLPNATYAYISTGVPVWEYPFFTHVEPRLRRDNIGTFDYLDDSMYICTLFRNSATWHFKVSTTSDKSAYSLRIYIEYIKTYDTSYS